MAMTISVGAGAGGAMFALWFGASSRLPSEDSPALPWPEAVAALALSRKELSPVAAADYESKFGAGSATDTHLPLTADFSAASPTGDLPVSLPAPDDAASEPLRRQLQLSLQQNAALLSALTERAPCPAEERIGEPLAALTQQLVMLRQELQEQRAVSDAKKAAALKVEESSGGHWQFLALRRLDGRLYAQMQQISSPSAAATVHRLLAAGDVLAGWTVRQVHAAGSLLLEDLQSGRQQLLQLGQVGHL